MNRMMRETVYWFSQIALWIVVFITVLFSGLSICLPGCRYDSLIEVNLWPGGTVPESVTPTQTRPAEDVQSPGEIIDDAIDRIGSAGQPAAEP